MTKRYLTTRIRGATCRSHRSTPTAFAPFSVYFWNTSNPHILQLRAHWRGIATDDAQFASLVEEVRRCNSTRTGPKAYLAPFEDGHRYGLIAECDIVATNGLSEAQLDAFFETSMSMMMGFFSDLEETLSDFVTWNEEEDHA